MTLPSDVAAFAALDAALAAGAGVAGGVAAGLATGIAGAAGAAADWASSESAIGMTALSEGRKEASWKTERLAWG